METESVVFKPDFDSIVLPKLIQYITFALLPANGRCDGEVYVLLLLRFVDVDVEMLVGVDTAEASQARWPDVPAHDHVLVLADPVLRRQ